MFAVLKTGGKQYKVAQDDVITVERLPGEAGTTVQLAEVLMVGDEKGVKVGTPLVAGTVVNAEIVEQTRGTKIIVFKKKRRHRYRRKNGHRQDLTVLRITDVGGAKTRKAAPAKEPAEKAEAPKAAAKTADAKQAAPKKAEAPKAEVKAKAEAPKAEAKPKTEAKKAASPKSAPKKTAAKAPKKAEPKAPKKAEPKAKETK